jgi:hypothetical protein
MQGKNNLSGHMVNRKDRADALFVFAKRRDDPSITNGVIGEPSRRNRYIVSGRSPNIYNIYDDSNGKSAIRYFSPIRFYIKFKPRTKLLYESIFGGVSASHRLVGSALSKPRSKSRSGQSGGTDEQPYQGGIESSGAPPCRFTSGVCGLPLGAKVALTIILTGVASGVWLWTLWGFFERRRNAIQLLSSGLIGCSLIGLSFYAATWGSTY